MRLKLFQVFPFFLITISSYAQVGKGVRMIGSTIGTSFIGTGETRYSGPEPANNYLTKQNQVSINLTPSAGWFFTDQLAGGIQLLAGYSNFSIWRESLTNGNTYVRDENRNMDYGAGIFLRYYFISKGSLLPFLQLQGNGGSGKTKTEGFYEITNYRYTYEGESDERIYSNAGLNAGVTKMISASIGLDATIGYTFSSNRFITNTNYQINDNGTNLTSRTQVQQRFKSNGLNIGLGVQVFLPKKSK
ncbi:MAG: hypothetical protein ACXWB9_04650 [Flavisolibacter sp.]